MSFSDPFPRATSSKTRRHTQPITKYTVLRRAHIPMSGHGVLPSAASWIARKPHVGERNHDTGPSQLGSTVSGMIRPVAIHIGYCVAIPSEKAAR